MGENCSTFLDNLTDVPSNILIQLSNHYNVQTLDL